VFEDFETVRIDLEGEKQWHAELTLATAPNGWHAVSASYLYPTGGGGSLPSVWDRVAFTSRHEAIAHAIEGLIASYERVRGSAYAPETQARTASRMLETLRGYRQSTKQLSLF
jgi:hypothetical protein